MLRVPRDLGLPALQKLSSKKNFNNFQGMHCSMPRAGLGSMRQHGKICAASGGMRIRTHESLSRSLANSLGQRGSEDEVESWPEKSSDVDLSSPYGGRCVHHNGLERKHLFKASRYLTETPVLASTTILRSFSISDLKTSPECGSNPVSPEGTIQLAQELEPFSTGFVEGSVGVWMVVADRGRFMMNR